MATRDWRYVLLFILLEGTIAVISDENSTGFYVTENSTAVSLSENITFEANEFVPSSIDDFIVINIYGYARLRSAGKILTNKGIFGTQGMWLVDRNGTNYLLVGKSGTQEKKEWQEALQNSTDSTVCVEEVCLDRKSAEKRIKWIIAYQERSLLPSYVTPFSIMVSFFVVAGVVGISGNILIISGILRSKSTQNSTNVLLCSLVVSDILVLALCLPMQVIQAFFFYRGLFDKHVCRLWFLMKYSSVVLSVFTMMAMAFERYVAVCHPLKARSYCTAKNARRAVGLIWTISILVSSPAAIAVITSDTDKRCFMRFNTNAILFAFNGVFALLVFAIPLGVMVPLYIRVFHVLWKSTLESSKLTSTENYAQKDTEQVKVRKQVIKMLVMVLVMFVILWGPAVLYDLIRSIEAFATGTQTINISTKLSIGLQSVGLCNSFVNPLLYTAMSKQYQQYVKSLFPCTKAKHSINGVDSSIGNSQGKQTSQEVVSN